MADDLPGNLKPPKEPKASLPIRFEQSLMPQIPPDTWSKLSGEQFFNLANQIMEFSCEMERKRFDSEQERIKREDAAGTRNLVVGALIVIVGFGAAAYLAVENQSGSRTLHYRTPYGFGRRGDRTADFILNGFWNWALWNF